MAVRVSGGLGEHGAANGDPEGGDRRQLGVCRHPRLAIARKRAGRRGPPVLAALEGGKNQNGLPGLARIDARVCASDGSDVGSHKGGLLVGHGPRRSSSASSVRQPFVVTIGSNPNDGNPANEEGLRRGQKAEPTYRAETPSRDATPFLPFSVVAPPKVPDSCLGQHGQRRKFASVPGFFRR